MSEAHHLARLARQIEETQAISRYRAAQTMDQLEEIILYWDDSRARDFARGHEAPMRALVSPLHDNLRRIAAITTAIEPQAHQIEELARRAFGEQETARDLGQQCTRHLETARYHVADAHDRSAICQSVADTLRQRATALGTPPV